MTKSIDKAQKGNVLIKGNVGDNIPSFEKVELLKINDKTLGDLFKEQGLAIKELYKEIEKLKEDKEQVLKEFESLKEEFGSVVNQVVELKQLLKDTIESWVKLWEN